MHLAPKYDIWWQQFQVLTIVFVQLLSSKNAHLSLWRGFEPPKPPSRPLATPLDAIRSTALVVDAPKISCYSSEALIGDKNVHLSCVIRAKPRLSALFWIIDGNGTALAEGEVINGHWTLVMVSLLTVFYIIFLQEL